MKFFVDIDSHYDTNPLTMVLKLVVAKKTGATVAESADTADIVIADTPRKLLAYLKAGKRWVIQFVLVGPGQEPAVGLATSPLYEDRFRAFSVLGMEGAPDPLAMFAFITDLVTKEKEAK